MFLFWPVQVVQKLDIERFNLTPSRLRSIPILANAKKRKFIEIEGDALRLLSDKRFYSAHLASRLGVNSSPTIQFLHCQRNLEQVANVSGKPETPLFEGTLITPIEAPFIPTPDAFLHNTLNRVVESLVSQGFPKVYQHNHAFNYWRNLSYATNNDIASGDFLSNLDTWLENAGETPEADSVRKMVEQYKSILENPPKWNDLRALFVAALEYRLALRTGLSAHSTCVSGKDREGLFQIMLDAMDLFEVDYKKFPELHSDNDYNKLRDLFLCLLQNEHQILEAEYGAPGAHGLKTLSRYLPPDYVELINKWSLNDTAMDMMASSNDLDKIKLEKFRPGYSGALIEALNIPPDAVKIIYTQMRNHCPRSINEQLPADWKLPRDVDAAQASPEWLADLLHHEKTACYVRWLIRARNVKTFLIKDLVSVNHKISHLSTWESTTFWKLLGSSTESAPPKGIAAIREIMTETRKVTDPLGICTEIDTLGICTEILCAGHTQREVNSWTRWPATESYYSYLDNILTDEQIADPQVWIKLCRPLYAMLSKFDLSERFSECNDLEVIKILFALMPASQNQFNLSNNNLFRFGEKLPELLAVIPPFVKCLDLRNNGLDNLDSRILEKVIAAIPEHIYKVVLSPNEFKMGSSQRAVVEKHLGDAGRFVLSYLPIDDIEEKVCSSNSSFFTKPLPVEFTDPEDKQKIQESSLS